MGKRERRQRKTYQTKSSQNASMDSNLQKSIDFD